MNIIQENQQKSNKQYQMRRRQKLGVLTREQLRKNYEISFIQESQKVHKNKYGYSLVAYKNKYTKVEIICLIHEIFLQTPDAHKRGQGCPDCAHDNRVKSRKRKTTKEFIDEASIKHNNRYTYTNTKYTNIKSKVVITCNEHGDFFQEAKAHLQGQGCPECGNISRSAFFESKGEQQIRKFLEANDINFTPQKTFDDCKHIMLLRYDFYLPDCNTLIEYDGEQHYHFVPRFHGTMEGFDNLKVRDEIKNKFAEDNNIKLLRIRWDQEQHIPQMMEKLIT
jgi:hypothetical protein